jgi:UDP-glucose 4-epimerase
VGESVAEPLSYYRNNFYSLINLLNARGSRAVNFVFSSSCTVYGQPKQLPVAEDAPVQPAESPYGNTKQIAEEMLRDLTKVNENFNVISLRYFNPVGAHASALIGELPIGIPQNLVPFITQTAIGKRESLTVYGSDYNTPDGSCIRDYIHVVDLAKAHIAALEALQLNKTTNYDVFNIGTGKGISVLEVIQAFETVSGEKLNYTIGPRRPGDVEQIWGEVKKAEQLLGWKAELDLAEMMRSAWAWENYLSEHPIV